MKPKIFGLGGFFGCTVTVYEETPQLFKARIYPAREDEDCITAHGRTYNECLLNVKEMLTRRAHALLKEIMEMK